MNPLRAKQLVIDIPSRADGQPLDFTVEPGQVWGVLGPNGAGKTTLLHTLAGLRVPRSGSVQLGDHSLTELKRRQISQQLGLVFQDRQDGFPATVLETALIGRSVFMCLHDLNLAARWCDHLLLLYPNGDACWGTAERMLVPAALERLYSQELLTVEVDGAPFFVPVRA